MREQPLSSQAGTATVTDLQEGILNGTDILREL